MKIKTRNDSSPNGKAKIFFNATSSDFEKYFEKWSNIILTLQSCAVCYDTESEFDDDMKTAVAAMPAMAIVVTNNFFSDSRAVEIATFARDNGIHIIPFLEDDCAERFNDLLGLFHCIDTIHQSQWQDELGLLFNTILDDDETTERIRSEFSSQIFLSYRKTEKDLAQKLISLIRQNAACRDTAIWYDDFLIPGENFDNSIRENIKACNLYTMSVTPNMLCECYAAVEEYPLACSEKKVILPVEMVPVNADAFKQQFKNAPELCSCNDLPELFKRLNEGLGISESALNNDPRHCYYIGLGYERGICTPRDREQALTLIEYAYNNRCTEAAFYFYNQSIYVTFDYPAAKRYIESAVKFAKEEYDTNPNIESAYLYSIAVMNCYSCYVRYNGYSNENALKVFEDAENDILKMADIFTDDKPLLKIASYLNAYFSNTNDIQKQEILLDKRYELISRLYYKHPESEKYRVRMAKCLEMKAQLLFKKSAGKNSEEIIKFLFEALEYIKSDYSLECKHRKASIYENIWNCKYYNRHSDSAKYILLAKEIYKDILIENTNPVFEHTNYFRALYHSAQQYFSDGENQKALEELKIVIDGTQNNLKFSQNFIKDYQDLYIASCNFMGVILFELGDYHNAEAKYLCVMDLLQAEYFTNNSDEIMQKLSVAYNSIKSCCLKLGKFNEPENLKYDRANVDLNVILMPLRAGKEYTDLQFTITNHILNYTSNGDSINQIRFTAEYCRLCNRLMVRDGLTPGSCFEYVEYVVCFLNLFLSVSLPKELEPIREKNLTKATGFYGLFLILGLYLQSDNPILNDYANAINDFHIVKEKFPVYSFNDAVEKIVTYNEEIMSLLNDVISACIEISADKLSNSYGIAIAKGDNDAADNFNFEELHLRRILLLINPTIENTVGYANSINNKGYLLLCKEKYDWALFYYYEAEKLYLNVFDKTGGIQFYVNLINCYSNIMRCSIMLDRMNKIPIYARKYFGYVPPVLDLILMSQDYLSFMLNAYASYAYYLQEQGQTELFKCYMKINSLLNELFTVKDFTPTFRKLSLAFSLLYQNEFLSGNIDFARSAAFLSYSLIEKVFNETKNEDDVYLMANSMFAYSTLIIQNYRDKDENNNAIELLVKAYKIYTELLQRYPQDEKLCDYVITAHNLLNHLGFFS